MMRVCLTVLLVTLATVHGIDREKLGKIPAPVNNFNINRWDGDWYLQWRFASCSWRGSDEFDDWFQQLSILDDGKVQATETWFNEACAQTTAFLNPAEGEEAQTGVFLVKDTFGNVWSGDQVVVATDYTSYSISYGCTKRGARGGFCDDYWVTVKTRRPTVGLLLRGLLEGILRFRFGLSLGDLRRIDHTGRCQS